MYPVLSTKTLYMQIPPLFGESYIGIKYQTKKKYDIYKYSGILPLC